MDGVLSAILNKIYALGEPGRYFIVEEDEFLEAFPHDIKGDGEALKSALERLVALGYIDVRYSGGNMFCVALLKNYEPEKTGEEKSDEPTPPPPPLNENFKIFLSAFLGGAASGIVAAATGFLIALLC